jgi:hypothetical protein
MRRAPDEGILFPTRVKDRPNDTPATTVLNRVRPTVVVRRRVYDPPPSATSNAHVGGGARSGDTGIHEQVGDEDEESGPPSSVNVARALASLRAHEIHRLEELLSADDEDEVQRAAAAAPAAPAVPTVKIGTSIALVELAQRMSVPTQELVTSLVTRGFFSVTVTTVLPRETARAAATMFGWQVEETDEIDAARAKVKSTKAHKPGAEKRNATATPKTSPKVKSKLAQKKPRSGSRG